MKKRIIADSCCDLSGKLREKLDMAEVPLTIRIGDKAYRDDESLDTAELIKDMKLRPELPSTSCPSPEDFMRSYREDSDNFVVTLSSELSGTYNSAVIAKGIFEEEGRAGAVHVFNSKSASAGETAVSLKINELIAEGLRTDEIVEQTSSYIRDMKTYFILESLDNLIKAGRIGKVKGKLASVLSIVPIMKATENGEIDLSEKVRGRKKAYRRLVEIVEEQDLNFEERRLCIAHCNCLERAIELRRDIERNCNFKEVVIVETQGISTVYANDGGIVIAF